MVVGSVAFDTVITPYGRVDDALGGAATYFAVAASYFCPVRVVAVVGNDFSAEHEAVLLERSVDTSGIERAPGRTFRWGGEYSWNLNERKTLFTELNVLRDLRAGAASGVSRHPLCVPGEHCAAAAAVRPGAGGEAGVGGARYDELLDRGLTRGAENNPATRRHPGHKRRGGARIGRCLQPRRSRQVDSGRWDRPA